MLIPPGSAVRHVGYCLAGLLLCGSAHSADLYVAPTGSDTGDGSKAAPFATIEKARDTLRATKQGPATVWIAGGEYLFGEPFELKAEDSGTSAAPVVYRAMPGEMPRLLGARKLQASDFAPVAEAETLARIAPEAKGKVFELDLKALGVKNTAKFAEVFQSEGTIAGLYCDGERMPISRFPNAGYMRIKKVLYTAGGPQGNWRDPNDSQKVPPGAGGGIFEYRDEFADKHATWAKSLDRGVWLKGYWRVAWENPALRVQAIDTAAHTVTFAKPIPNGIGNKYHRPAGNGREAYWTLNLLEEIDQPGEWALDFKDRKIYFYPPGDLAKCSLLLMDESAPIVSLDGASFVTLRGLTVEAGIGDGIRVQGGEGDLVAGCTVRWVNKYGVVLDGGKNNAVQSCDLYHLGAGGVWLGGGDEASSPRVAASHRVINNHIHHFAEIERVYAPGVNCGFTGGGGGGHHTAVGMLVANNLIHDTPHGAVLFGSMDSLFEYNEVFRYCLVSDDLGAFYSYDTAARHFGNITFRYNLMHSSRIGDGIYFDHDHPDMHIHGNIACLDSDGKRGNGYLFKQGEMPKNGEPQPFDCTNNISIHNSQGYEFVSILPHEGRIENNISVACKTPYAWREVKDGKVISANEYGTGPNKTYDADPGFADVAKLDFNLKPGAQLLKDLPGFKPIPMERIGLHLDEYRTTLPTADEIDRYSVRTKQDGGLDYDILDRPR